MLDGNPIKTAAVAFMGPIMGIISVLIARNYYNFLITYKYKEQIKYKSANKFIFGSIIGVHMAQLVPCGKNDGAWITEALSGDSVNFSDSQLGSVYAMILAISIYV